MGLKDLYNILKKVPSLYFKIAGIPFKYIKKKVKDPKKIMLYSGFFYGFLLSSFDYYWTYSIRPSLETILGDVINNIQKTYHLTLYNIVLLSPIPQIYKEYKNFKRLFGKIALGTSTLSWLINDTIGWFLLKLFNEGLHSAIESMKFLYVDGYLGLEMGKTIVVPAHIFFLFSILRTMGVIGLYYSISPISSLSESEKIKAKYIKEGLKYKSLEDRLD